MNTEWDPSECKVCGATPREGDDAYGIDGEIVHGKGCYVVSENGGGSTYAERITAIEAPPTSDIASPRLTRERLRALVDDCWNAATDSAAVPGTEWADRLIDRALFAILPSYTSPEPLPVWRVNEVTLLSGKRFVYLDWNEAKKAWLLSYSKGTDTEAIANALRGKR